jgi:TldD protein
MFEKLSKIIGQIDADYADIRYEIKTATKIEYVGKELTQIGTNSTDGYVLRVLNSGGMSTVVFTKEMDAENAVRDAVENAKLISRNTDRPVCLAKSEIIKDIFKPNLDEDPRNISIEEKQDNLKRLNNISLSYDKIATTSLTYYDVIREKYFISSEGSEIQEDLITTAVSGEITAKDGNLLQNVRVRAGGSNGFSTVRNQEDNLEQRTAIVLDLLKAKPIAGGNHKVILNQGMAGVFAHEAFGHFSEADIIETLPSMREKMKIGSKLGNEIVNIIDDATIPNQLGFYRYDDEGTKVRPVRLLEKGVLSGRLHSRRASTEFDEPISGHCVAEDFRFAPIIRMGSIYIEPSDNSFDDLLNELGDGMYILDPKGGASAGEEFSFGAQYGYEVKGGKVKGMVRDINISGNLYQTLKDIVMVGNDLELSTVGGCGKGQINIRSCHGGPHILIKNLVIGGA